MKKVTDLEVFALEDIWRPYWQTSPMSQKGTERPETLPVDLLETGNLLFKDKTGWADMVIDRLLEMDPIIPSYVCHELVNVVQMLMEERRK